MALSRTAKFYHENPAANAVRLAQQKRYDGGNGSTGRSKESIQKYKGTLAAWKAAHQGSKPKGKIVEAVHGKDGKIRWAAGEAARKFNRGDEVRKRNPASNPRGGGASQLA